MFPEKHTHSHTKPKKTTDEWHNVVNLWFLSEKSISLTRMKWHNENYECKNRNSKKVKRIKKKVYTENMQT